MEQERSYKLSWDDYRKRSAIFWTVFLSYVPGVWLIGGALSGLFGSDRSYFITAIAWMVAFALSHFYRMSWGCPRCGRAFFMKWWYGNSFAQKCVHCGLPKWAES